VPETRKIPSKSKTNMHGYIHTLTLVAMNVKRQQAVLESVRGTRPHTLVDSERTVIYRQWDVINKPALISIYIFQRDAEELVLGWRDGVFCYRPTSK